MAFYPWDLGSFSLLAEVPRGERKMRGKEETSAGLRCVSSHACTGLSSHACTGLSLTISNLLVTCFTTFRTCLRYDNRGLRNFQRKVSTGHAHSTFNETDFENQYVSTTSMVGDLTKERVGRRQRSLSFLPFFSCHERPLLAGKDSSFWHYQC